MCCAERQGKIHATVIFPILSAQKTMQSKFTTKWISINLKQDFECGESTKHAGLRTEGLILI
jgi:hypothetical protein